MVASRGRKNYNRSKETMEKQGGGDMNEAVEILRQWAQQMQEYDFVPWERLPEIDLYMDQVITYMDRQLGSFQDAPKNRLLTSSMINNYVKDKVLERPQQKKYSKEHLAMLTIICMLKPVLAIPDVASLLHYLLDNESKEAVYTAFCDSQSAAFSEICQRVLETSEQGESALVRLAAVLSIEANVRRTAAERIVRELVSREQAAAETKSSKKPAKLPKTVK